MRPRPQPREPSDETAVRRATDRDAGAAFVPLAPARLTRIGVEPSAHSRPPAIARVRSGSMETVAS